MYPHDESFTIDTTAPELARLAGIMRLSSPADYEDRFEPMRKALNHAPSYTIDVSQVRFLNSSGITSLSRLVLLARAQDKDLVVIGSESVQWHAKTLHLLKRLYARLEVRLVG